MKPDLGFIVSGVTSEGKYIIKVDSEGPATDAGLLDGDVVETLDGLSLAEFRASAWWPRAHGKPIKVVYRRGGMTLRGNVVVDVFGAPAVSVLADDALAAVLADDALATPVQADDAPAAVPEDDVPAAPIPVDGNIQPAQFPPNNADTSVRTFGPIGDQSWRYGMGGCVSDYGGCIVALSGPSGESWHFHWARNSSC